MTRSYRMLLAVALALAIGPLLGCDRQGHADATKKADAHGEDDGHGHGKAKAQAEGGPIKLSNDEIAAAGIEVEEIAERVVAERVQATAVVRPNQTKLARVAPRIPGRIVAVNVKLGDRVRVGQALALLDSVELGEARASYLQAQSEAALAKANLDRTERLLAEELIAAKELVRARFEYQKLRIAERASGDKLRLLGAAAGSIEGVAASTFPVVTPFAGIVIETNEAVIGALVQPDKPLFVVADLSVAWVEASLLEKDLGKVSLGNAAEVTTAAYPEAVFKGKVTYFASMLDKETRTIPVRIEVPNADGRLKPEMFARVAIETAGRGKALVVPSEAVVLMQGNPAVFIEGAAGFEPRTIEIGERLAGQVTVKEGLKPGDTVVTKGTYALKARQLKSQIGEGHAH